MKTTTKRFKQKTLNAIIHTCCYSLLLTQNTLLAYAAPVGGEVVGGNGSISQSGSSTTITQSSQNMAINWQSYNLNANEQVQYVQPNAASISLNNILSNNGSVIAGRIDANGRVILVNPNGLFFSSTAVLNVGGLIASGLSISPTDFMNGNYVFNEIAGSSGAVVNSGLINASVGGNVALVGKRVENKGLIVANLGSVALAAGKEAVLTFDNAGLLGVRVSQEILQSELGVDPAVINSGNIQAQGGRVLLTASQSQDVFSRAVNSNGIEQATSVVVNDDGSFTLGGADVLNSGSIDTSTTSAEQTPGRIVLIGENVTSSGTLKADAATGNGGEIELHANDMALLTQNSVTSARSELNGNGGIVKALGDKVGLFDQAKVDVSGANGGGKALIGGDFQGKNANVRNASTTIINPDAKIYADALETGNGGTVIAWADGNTYFLGDIFARGGSLAGNGGFVEVSGKTNLMFRGDTDRSATNGSAGVLLLDPRDITIGSSNTDDSALSDRTITFDECTGAGCTAAGDNFRISTSQIVAQLNNGAVILQAQQDIFVTDNITANVGNNNSLTLEAGNYIGITANINLRNGDLTLTAGSTNCGASCQTSSRPRDVDISGTIDTTGSITLNSANDVVITNAVGNTNRPSAITINATRNIEVQGDIRTNNGNFTATSTNGYFDNWFANNPTLNAGNGNVTITTGGATEFNNNGFIGGAFLGNIMTTGNGAAGTGTLTVTTTGGGIRQSTNAARNLTIAGAATFNAGTNEILLNNDANAIAGTITLGPAPAVPPAVPVNGGAVTLHNSIATVLGTVNATTLTVNAGTDLSLTGGFTTTGDTVLNFATATGATAGRSFTVSPNIALPTGPLTVNGGTNADTFTIDSNVAGTLNGDDGNDIFNIGANVAGTINGDGGDDDFNITAAGVNVTTLNGGADVNTLTGNNETNTWVISSANAGALNTTNGATAHSIGFSNIENLTGNAAADTFNYATTGSISGVVDGAGGADRVDQSTMAANITLGDGKYTSIETFVGGVGSSMTGSNTVNAWNINGANAGIVNDGTANTAFIGFNNLIGGTDTDTFTLAAGGSVTSIDGNGGTDTLVGQDIASSWMVTSTDAGTISWNTSPTTAATTVFSDIDNLTGGSGADTFNLTAAPATGSRLLSGVIDGGDGNDQVTTTNGGVVVQLGRVVNGHVNVDRIETLTAGGAALTNTLIGENVASTWIVSAANAGTVNSNVAFNNFGNVTGGSGTDTFIVNQDIGWISSGDGADIVTINAGRVTTINLGAGNDQFFMYGGTVGNAADASRTGVNGDAGDDVFSVAGGVVAGTIDGGGEATALGDRVTLADNENVNIGSGIALSGVTIADIEGVVSRNGTLNARDTYDTIWTIDGRDSGAVVERDNTGTVTTRLSFTGFATLNGSDGNDDFIVTNNAANNTSGQITGVINGNAGTNTLTVNLTGVEAGQVKYVGTGNDAITIAGTTGSYNGAYTPDATAIAVDQLLYTATGGTYAVNYTGVDSVQSDRTLGTLTVNGTADADTITLGLGNFAVGGRTQVDYTNVANLAVNGQAGADTVNLNTVNVAGNLTLIAEQITGSGTQTANTLILDNVGQFGSDGAQITTSLNNLQLMNTGAVHINETNDLTINTTGTATNTGQFTIAGLTTFNAGNGGSLTLNNAQNDFDTVATANGINAAAISLTDRNDLNGGLTADAIILNTVSGVGTSGSFTTDTARLTVTNTGGNAVNITNTGTLTVGITNLGDIDLVNQGDIIVDRLYTNGGNHAVSGPYNGDVNVAAINGSIQAYQGSPAYSDLTAQVATAAPDIVAQNLDMRADAGAGNLVRPLSVRVNDRFFYVGGRGYIYYYGNRPTNILGASDLVVFSSLDGLSNQQLIEIDSLEDVDPAIFTAVRNYYHEDVAIMMPRDQRLDALDEDEEKEGTAEKQ